VPEGFGRGRMLAIALRALGVLGLVLVCAALAAPAVRADFPYLPKSGGNALNRQTFKVPPGEVPTNLGNDYKFLATPETPNPANPQSAESAKINMQQDELCGVRGASIADPAATQPPGSCVSGPATNPTPVKTAFNVSTGRPDVTIAVLDSGIKWNDAGAMTALRKKVRLNAGELPAPNHNRVGTSLEPGVDCSTYQPATARDYNARGGTAPSTTTYAPYDVNHDGVFNVLDYACDDRVSVSDPRRHGPPGVITPEDIILAFSMPGVDHDHNGYAGDIAGWNYVDNTNNPYDDVQYGHGTGEARDSNGEANTKSDLGTCPNCMVLPLRVGESFIADVNRFAQAVLYATDNNVLVVQEALGTLNNSSLARQAIDYAYNHGTAVIASAADEAAEHHNQPGALPHTIVVNSVRPYDPTFTPSPRSYLQFNGCTNFSTKITLAVPSSSCSSEATGKSAGVAGLIYSAAFNARDAGKLGPSDDCRRPDGTKCVITPNEVRQLMASGHVGSTQPADAGNGGQADDVNFEASAAGANPGKSCAVPTPTPTCTDPNTFTFAPDQNPPTGQLIGSPLANSHRYPARKGFDEFYGYGRLNAYTATSAVAASTIPPEAEINSPDWFQRIDPTQSSLPIQGHVYARGASYTCQVFVAPGGQPNNGLTTETPPGDFKAVSTDHCDGSTTHTDAFDGKLGTVDLKDLRTRFPPNVSGSANSFAGNENGNTAQTSNGRPNTLPYAFTVRVVVTAGTGTGQTPVSGEDRRQMFLHRDQDMLSGFPKELLTDGASSPLLADIAGENRNQLILATSDGVIHAYHRDGSELPGWPVHTDPLPLHTQGETAFTSGQISTAHYGAVLGGVAAGDLFHDGRLEVVADDNQGKVYAWDASGHQVFKQEANPLYSGNPATGSFERKGARDRVEHGFFAGPVLADLEVNGNKQLDIIAAGQDRHVYAWHLDGSPVPGYPVLVVDPTKVARVDPTNHHVTFDATNVPDEQLQGKIVDTPAVGNVDGSGKPAIVVGTNEEYKAMSGNEGPINASNVNAATFGALAPTGLLSFGNTRLYVIKHDGNLSGKPFADHWPKPLGQVTQQLLPDVGEGVTGDPVIGSVTCGPHDTNNGGPKIGALSDVGPAYLFNPDGSSCYGSSGGQDTTLAVSGTPGMGQFDTPVIPAVGNPAFAHVGPGGKTAFLAPAAGLMRAIDAAAPEYQPSQDFLAAWDPTTSQFQAGYPSPVNDLQFLTGPSAGDVTGLAASQESAVEGTASLDLTALNSAGAPASPSWPKLTGDWTVASPLLGSFGTLDTDPAARKDVVSITRSGTLSVYSTPASACSPSSWPRFHHDIANSGDFSRDAVPPGQPSNLTISGGRLAFTAPGNDLLCGTADHYEVVQSDAQITFSNFAAAEHVAGAPAPAPAGTAQSFALPASPRGYVAIRAVDRAGNLGPFAVIATGSGAGSGSGGATFGGSGSGSSGSGSGGSGSGGGAGAGTRTCSARQAPAARFARRRGRVSRHGLRLRGSARAARGCPVIRVSVSVARAVGRRCRFLRADGSFGRPTSCRRNLYLPAVGTIHWHFDFRTQLARGHYKVFVRAVNAAGIAERRNFRRNYVALRVR